MSKIAPSASPLTASKLWGAVSPVFYHSPFEHEEQLSSVAISVAEDVLMEEDYGSAVFESKEPEPTIGVKRPLSTIEEHFELSLHPTVVFEEVASEMVEEGVSSLLEGTDVGPMYVSTVGDDPEAAGSGSDGL